MEHQQIIDFWFRELQPSDWYRKSNQLDELIAKRYLKVHRAASQGELFEWRTHPMGRVAEIIVLDQFSRNLFREQKESFAYDGMALALAQEAISLECLNQVDDASKHHLLLPYMHSESLLIHKQAVILREKHQLSLDYQIKHQQIIERFGRYPHRNSILGRESTQEEKDFLLQPGSSF